MSAARFAGASAFAVALALSSGCARPGTLGMAAPTAGPPRPPIAPPDDTFFATVAIETASSVEVMPSNGDLWPSCWSDDDALYAAAGDGWGFDEKEKRADIAVGRLIGTPDDPTLFAGTWLASRETISTLTAPGPYYRKPTGMLCSDGDVYLALQSLDHEAYDDAPNATVVRSRDHGQTWEPAPATPMFDRHTFTTIMFLDRGRDGAAASRGDGYAYAYGIDQSFRFTGDARSPTRLYLARVPAYSVQNVEAWEYFASDDPARPAWSHALGDRRPVLVDETVTYAALTPGTKARASMTRIAQGSVVYDAPLDRYLYASWTEYTFEIYSAPKPWGPWGKVISEDFGALPWTRAKNGGYGTVIPSKYISADGRSMWLAASSWSQGIDHNHFSLRRVRLVPWAPSTPANARGPENLASTGEGVTPFVRAIHEGRLAALNDGDPVTTEDSRTGEAKSVDFWGYTFTRAYAMNAVDYVTGAIDDTGGFFESLHVEVRQNGRWLDAGPIAVNPTYALNASVPAAARFTLHFADTWGDGVRIAGKPGGTQAHTSIGELGVRFE